MKNHLPVKRRLRKKHDSLAALGKRVEQFRLSCEEVCGDAAELLHLNRRVTEEMPKPLFANAKIHRR
jgi:hypothetical protein